MAFRRQMKCSLLSSLGLSKFRFRVCLYQRYNNGNLVSQVGSFQYADGTDGAVSDVNFTVDVASFHTQDDFVFV